jgi:hypothetical protein
MIVFYFLHNNQNVALLPIIRLGKSYTNELGLGSFNEPSIIIGNPRLEKVVTR